MTADPSFRIAPVDLRAALGGTGRVVRRGPVEALRIVDTVTRPDSDAEVDAALSAIGGNVGVSAVVSAEWQAPCRRCGEQIEGRIDAEVDEVFARRPVEGETYPFDGEQLDLAELVRDVVALELPPAPMPPVDGDDRCERCGRPPAGTDDDPGDAAVEAPDRPAAEGGDPRWSVLDALRDHLDDA